MKKKVRRDNRERDAGIINLFNKGWTEPSLARKYSMSKERIRQILRREGVGPRSLKAGETRVYRSINGESKGKPVVQISAKPGTNGTCHVVTPLVAKPTAAVVPAKPSPLARSVDRIAGSDTDAIVLELRCSPQTATSLRLWASIASHEGKTADITKSRADDMRECHQLMMAGLSAKEIGEKLRLAVTTVYQYAYQYRQDHGIKARRSAK